MKKILLLISIAYVCFASALSANLPVYAGGTRTGAPANSAAGSKQAETRAKLIQAKMFASEGLKYFNKKQYKEAIPKLIASADNRPLDPAVQYYLGLSALRENDYKLAEQALSRVMVMSPPDSKWARYAAKCFESYRKEMNRVKPYSCLYEGSKFWRWSTQSRPLKIYIANGLELPKGYSGGDLSPAKMAALAKWLHDPKFTKSLKPYRHYKEQYRGYVEKGLSEWAFANSQGYMRFSIVEDPQIANVFVFWCATLPGDAPGNTVFSDKKGEPVVIQLSVEFIDKLPLNLWPVLVQTIACHEFGHAWGLQHSTFKRDIMYPTDKIKFTERGTDQTGPNVVTNNDAATLRALYDLPAPVLK